MLSRPASQVGSYSLCSPSQYSQSSPGDDPSRKK